MRSIGCGDRQLPSSLGMSRTYHKCSISRGACHPPIPRLTGGCGERVRIRPARPVLLATGSAPGNGSGIGLSAIGFAAVIVFDSDYPYPHQPLSHRKRRQILISIDDGVFMINAACNQNHAALHNRRQPSRSALVLAPPR